MTFSVGAAELVDLDELVPLAARTWPLACPEDLPAEAIAAFIAAHLLREHFLSYLTDPAHDVFVARGATGLVGWGMLVFGEPVDPEVARQVRHRPTVELSKIYVAPELHGTGISRLLLDYALERARYRGVRGMWLGTNAGNLRAQRFYTKHGFTRAGSRRFEVGGRLEHDHLYEIAIPTQL